MKFPPEVYTPKEIQSLISACGFGITGFRNRAVLVVLWRSGVRIQEALSLTLPDVDEKDGTLRIRSGKGGKYRVVAMDSGGFGVLGRWIEVRKDRINPPRGIPIFCTTKGKPMGPDYFRKLFPRLRRIAKLEKRVHAHGFRHTHATELAMENVPVPVISAQLGHTNIATTVRYLARIAPSKVVEAIRARESWDVTPRSPKQ